MVIETGVTPATTGQEPAMNPALVIALHPAARIAGVIANLSSELLPEPSQHRAAGAHPMAGPAAEMLRYLPRGATLAVQQPLGLDVVCLKGTLWITHDGDTIDHVLESGCTYTAKRGERMLLNALADARFIVGANDD
jgi:hypothetical protein